MQRRNPTLVQRVRIRADFDEIGDHVSLRHWIQPMRTGSAVGCIVERLGAPSVTGANVGASRDERLGQWSLLCGGTDVKRRVPGVDVVMDCSEEVGLRVLTTRADTNRTE